MNATIRVGIALASAFLGGVGAEMAAAQTTAARVILDMDPARPGFQNRVKIRPNQTQVPMAVYIVGGAPQQMVWGIGYLGGLDRGIAVGHVPGQPTHGVLTGLSGGAGQPVMAGGSGYAGPGGFQKVFVGPEVQYVEYGPGPSPLPLNPTQPVFTVTANLAGPMPGDRFDLYIADAVRIWRGEGGAFSTTSAFSLDTGGDAVLDATPTLVGQDGDAGTPVPPGAFLVDYIDGPLPSGPAQIEVLPCIADYDASGAVAPADIFAFVSDWFALAPRSDSDADGVVTVADIFDYIAHFFAGC